MDVGRGGPRIYGVGVVQNEEDVIGESLSWAGRFCERIWLWDLGSSDRTWEVLSGMASERFVVSRRPDLAYAASLRSAVVAEARPHLPEDAWIYILDADEFLVGDPRPLLEGAARAGADLVKAWFLNFFPTQEDVVRMDALGVADWSKIPLDRRLRSFMLDPWPDKRFIRLTPGLSWTASGKYNRIRLADGAKLNVYRRKALVRHYRFRSPAQVARRFQTRQEQRLAGYSGFDYDKTQDFRSYAVPKGACRLWREDQEHPKPTWLDFLRYQLGRLRRGARR